MELMRKKNIEVFKKLSSVFNIHLVRLGGGHVMEILTRKKLCIWITKSPDPQPQED